MSPNILQQHHILEDHAGEWILSHKFGLGLHGEQGGEAIHREFRRLERMMSSQPNRLKKMQYAMTEHHIDKHSHVRKSFVVKKKGKNYSWY